MSNNFFRRLTDIATREKKDASPKPAITPEILSDYFRLSNRSDIYSKSLLEGSQSFEMNGSGRINGRSVEADYDERATNQLRDRRLAKSSFRNMSEDNLDAIPSPLMSRSTDYFSDIISSARESIRHDLKITTKSSSLDEELQADIYGNVKDRISEVGESQLKTTHDRSENENNNLVRHNLIPDHISERSSHLELSANRRRYNPQLNYRVTDSKNSEHVITINIGRIEIHATKEEKRAQRRGGKERQKFPNLSLSEYLQKRSDTKQ